MQIDGGRRRAPWVLLLPFLLFSSCGYHVGDLYEVKRLRLNLLDNTVERRTHEFDLSAVLAREIAGAGICLNPADATHELTGTIEKFREPALVETGKDVVLVGSISVTMRLRLTVRATGRILVDEQRTETASFSTDRGESRESAREEVFDRLARWVLTKLEKDW